MQWLPLALCALTPSVFAGTWTVAKTAGPGVDFTSIQAAVDTAVDGDRILILSGTYAENVVIDGKALTLHGESGASLQHTSLTGTHAPLLAVRNLAASQTVQINEPDLFRVTGV